MPPKRKKYKVVKVSLGYEPPFHSSQFEPTSTLFMELLENKAKIKEDVRDLEWRSKYQQSGKFIPTIEEMYVQTKADTEKEIEESQDGYHKQDSPSLSSVSFPKSLDTVEDPHTRSGSLSLHSSMRESPSRSSQGENKFTSRFLQAKEEIEQSDHLDHFANREESYTSGMFKSLVKPRTGSPSQDIKSNTFVLEDEEESLSKYRTSRENVEKRGSMEDHSSGDSLMKLMRGDISDEENYNPTSSTLLTSSHGGAGTKESNSLLVPTSVAASTGVSSTPPPVSVNRQIPSLEAILKNQVPAGYASQKGSSSGEANVANMSYIGTEKDLYRKRELLAKFQRLKRDYDGHVPEVNEYMDLRDLEREFEIVNRQLSIDSKVVNYKRYLSIGFMGLEFVLSTFLKFDDIKGFAKEQSQMMQMNEYEKLLREIGEKHHVTTSSQWPPELRLVGLVFMNAAVFLFMRMISKATGSQMMSMLGGASSSPSSGIDPRNKSDGVRRPSGDSFRGDSENIKPNKRKMRGPDIDIEDLDEGKKLN